jgi:hypothetical protein
MYWEKLSVAGNDSEFGTFVTIIVVQPDPDSLGLQNVVGWSDQEI